MNSKLSIVAVLVALALSGCASMGVPSGKLPEGVSVSSVQKKEGNLTWWKDYPDEGVVSLVDKAVAQNLSVQSLQMRLEAAKIAASSVSSSIAPSGGVSVNATNTIFGNGSEISKSANASWTLPLYEKASSSKLLSDSQYLQALWNVEASKQVLAGNVIVAYTNQQLAIMRYKVAKDNWFLQSQLLTMMKKELKEGATTVKAVEAQEQLVEEHRLIKEKALALCVSNNHVLAAYLGVNDFDSIQSPEFKWQSSFPKVDVDNPMILKNRPDVKLAEAKLLSAAASVGIAAADLMPQLQLSFSTNKTSSTPSISVMGAQITLPLLNWYFLNQQHKMTSKYFEESIYSYNDALINAWSEVGKARAQWAVAVTEEQVKLRALDVLTKEALRLDTEYRLGKVSYKEVINAQLAHGNAKLSYYDAYLAKTAAWVRAKQETLN